MPSRFLHLKWYRRHEYRILGAMILWGMLLLFYAQHQQANDIRAQSQRADQRFAGLTKENHELAEQAKRQAASAAATAYASCRRQQEQIAAQREFYHLVLPRLDLARTTDQQVLVADFYHDLHAHHILTIPVCQRPPGDSG